MSKHNHQGLAEQIQNKGHGSAPFHDNPYQVSESFESKDTHKKIVVDDHSIQLKAYHIHREKGGSALENWLEAERNLKNAVSRLINEGDPNTQI